MQRVGLPVQAVTRYPHEFWRVVKRGLYLHPGGREAIRANGFIFVAGEKGIDPKTNKMVEGGIAAETRQTAEEVRSERGAALPTARHKASESPSSRIEEAQSAASSFCRRSRRAPFWVLVIALRAGGLVRLLVLRIAGEEASGLVASVLEALEAGHAYSSLSLSQGARGEDGETIDLLDSLGEIEPRYEGSDDRAVLAPGFRPLVELVANLKVGCRICHRHLSLF